MTETPINARFPQGRTAFLLIHGIGQQNPYETVDYFAQNLLQYFEEQKLPTDLAFLPYPALSQSVITEVDESIENKRTH